MLKGKTALVTGSTRGIGAATASALAAQGCHVMLNGFGEASEIEQQRAALADQHGVTVAYHGADLDDLSQVEALMRQTQEKLGAVDILVNNAVIRYFHRIDDFVVEDWDHALAVNLSAPFHLTRLVLPDMRKPGALPQGIELATIAASRHTDHEVNIIDDFLQPDTCRGDMGKRTA